MKVKGSAVMPVREFVKTKHPDRYDEWFNALPEESQEIVNEIMVSNWYPVDPAMTYTTKAVVDVLYNGDMKVAYDLGIFSADYSLKGIYKVFVRLGRPSYIVKKASAILPTYYQPATIELGEVTSKSAVVRFTEFEQLNEYIEPGIHGWMVRALEICGAKNISVKISKSFVRGDDLTEFILNWE